MSKETVIHIASRDRATEVALLLESLRTQTYQDFDIVILDDGSEVPLQNFYFIQYIVNKLKMGGHNVNLLYNQIPSGVSQARQTLVDFSMKYGEHKYIVRIDDDSICDSKFLEKLKEGIDAGYDLVGCLVPPYAMVPQYRDIKHVKPIIGECRLNDKAELIMNFDDCGYLYTKEELIPSHHFRSSCMYKKDMHKHNINYNSRLSKNGFREEQIFSFKALCAGYKIAIHTGAVCWHMLTPSGGEKDTMNMTQFNQGVFEDTIKKMYEEHGDFIHAYNVKLNLEEKEYSELKLQRQNNLVKHA